MDEKNIPGSEGTISYDSVTGKLTYEVLGNNGGTVNYTPDGKLQNYIFRGDPGTIHPDGSFTVPAPKFNLKNDVSYHPESRPIPPQKDASLDTWFVWYHQMKDNGFKVTLKDIATKTGYSRNTIRNKHAEYLAEIKE